MPEIQNNIQGGKTMNLIKYRPANALANLNFDSMLDNFFSGSGSGNGHSHPKVDVRETENAYIMDAELPGCTEKDIDVSIDDNLLTVSSRNDETAREQKEGYLIRERKAESFQRSFVLPKDADKKAIDASFKNGLLTLTIDKTPESKPRNIEVKAGK